MPPARAGTVAALLLTTAALAAPAAVAYAGTLPGIAMVDRVIQDSRIHESSGLAASRRHRGVLYTHNDSGDGPRIFAINRYGETTAVLSLPKASARDWEDIAAGPHETLWIADIGNNSGSRTEIQVYRTREPATLNDQSLPSTRFRLVYPDGTHDAEALLVRPDTGRLYVVSKESSGGAVYRAPKRLRPDAVNRLTRLRTAPRTVTGGDIAADGRVVLRDYARAYVYRRMDDARSRVIDLPNQPQGESIAFGRLGRRIYVGSERTSSPVWRISVR